MAFKNGHTVAAVQEATIGGISSAMGAIFILLAVGSLIGTWNLAGTIPTIVSYGLAVLRPVIFFASVALICALVGAVTGSSWTTAGTLGVAFVGMAPILGLSSPITAGATAFVGKPGQGRVLNGVEAIYSAMASGHVAHSSNATINRPVFARRHVQHAHNGVADPRRSLLRRDHGTRGLPRADLATTGRQISHRWTAHGLDADIEIDTLHPHPGTCPRTHGTHREAL